MTLGEAMFLDIRLSQDLQQLQGTWKVISCEQEGISSTPQEVGIDHIVILGRKLTLRHNGAISATYQIGIDPTCTPKRMDWIDERSPKGLLHRIHEWLLGPPLIRVIYALEGKRLRICFPMPQKPAKVKLRYPETFQTENEPFVLILAEAQAGFASSAPVEAQPPQEIAKGPRGISSVKALAIEYRAYLHTEKGEYEAAIADYSELIALEPQFAKAYLARGDAYEFQGKFNFAIRDYSEAIRLAPEEALGYVCRGRAQQREGKLAEAVSDLTAAIRLDPCNAGAYFLRGASYLYQQHFPEAISDLTEAIKLMPHASAYSHRGMAYDAAGEFEKAVADHSEAIRQAPDLAEGNYLRALVFARKGDHDRAIADLSEAIRCQPNNPITYEERAKCYRLVGESANAFRDELKAQDLSKS